MVSMVLLMKFVPLSLIRVIGHQNLVIIFSYRNFTTTSLVHDSIGSTFSHFVTYSTVVIMYIEHVLYPKFQFLS